MPEKINIIELQRKIRTLESNLIKEQKINEAFRARQVVLERQIGTLERQKEQLEKQVRDLTNAQRAADQGLKACKEELNQLYQEKQTFEKRENALIQENRKLADSLSKVDHDLELFRERAEKAAEAIQAAKQKITAELNAAHAAELKGLQGERAQLESELALLSQQLKQEGKVPLLPPEKVANLMGDLVDRLGGQMPGMKLRTGEMKLKVAFGAAGDISGFVVPTPDSKSEIKDSLHEVTFHFDRSAAIGTGIKPVDRKK